jgi:hypothetical protein
MTTIHNATLAAGASSASLTVLPLEPHGLNAAVECAVYCVNGAEQYLVASAKPGYSKVFYPTTDTIVITNMSEDAGVVQVTAK